MTTFADAVQILFEADTGAGGIATLATGGIYTFEDTKRLGLSHIDTPNAWDSNGILLPTIILKDRDQVRDNGILEDAGQVISFREVLETWYYEEGEAGYASIELMRNRAFKLLHGIKVSSCLVRWVSNTLRRRDSALAYASMEKSDYEIRSLQQ
jgi:hypothetical protein